MATVLRKILLRLMNVFKEVVRRSWAIQDQDSYLIIVNIHLKSKQMKRNRNLTNSNPNSHKNKTCNYARNDTPTMLSKIRKELTIFRIQLATSILNK